MRRAEGIYRAAFGHYVTTFGWSKENLSNDLDTGEVNNTGDMQRPITEIIPLRDVKVRLRRSGVKSVRALWLEKDLPFRQDGEVCEFTVPDLKLYEVISVE